MVSNKVKSASKVQETTSGNLAQTTIRQEDFSLLQNFEGECLTIVSRGAQVRSLPQTPIVGRSGGNIPSLPNPVLDKIS